MSSPTRIRIDCSINGDWRSVEFDASQRLIDVLREELRLTGTKEGCGKGECGACTVLMNGRSVNSCLVMGYQADGAEIWTIEGLPRLWAIWQGAFKPGKPDAELSGSDISALIHPLQKAFIECGSSQCGICIPGMIVSAADLLHRNPRPNDEEIRYGLAGNLCRCTGYTKIFEGVKRAAAEMRSVSGSSRVRGSPPVQKLLTAAQEKKKRTSRNPHIASTLKEALTILSKTRRRQLAGGTDALVRAKDGFVSPVEMFDVFRIREMRGIQSARGKSRHFPSNGAKVLGEIRIGAATTFTEVMESPLLQKFAPALVDACAIVGGPQIRNRGTLGGNFANASPAADSVPALMSMGAIVEIHSVQGKREVPSEKFFLGPGESVLKKNEIIVSFLIPMLDGVRGCYVRLGQRRAQAISKVDIALTAVPSALLLKPQTPQSPFKYLGIGVGSVAPTVFRAVETEKILKAGRLDSKTMALAEETIKREVRPIDDIRSSANYRRDMSAVLLSRAIQKITAMN